MSFKGSKKKTIWQTTAVSLWAVLCLSLATWWMIFSLKQLDLLKSSQLQEAEKLARQQSMLLQEGVALIVLLVLGAVALFYYVLREKRNSQRIQEFFAVFTHELRTSLASLRLQVESLEEDLVSGDRDSRELTKRLVKDTVRLEIQLDNALILTNLENQNLFMEEVQLREFLENQKYQWPELEIRVSGEAACTSDRRLLEAVFRNIFFNAYKHGGARAVAVKLKEQGSEILVDVVDDGGGFSGDRVRLGEAFFRHQSQSGSGLGLYLVKKIVGRLGGSAEFPESKEGFAVHLKLKRGL